MALLFYIHWLPFAPKKMGFWVQKGKILKFSKFSTQLTSEALEALLCFPKAWKMFVSREDLQTMILSTERPLCHVGEPRYGPPKFWRLEKMSGSDPIFLGTLDVHISAPWRGTQPVQYSISLCALVELWQQQSPPWKTFEDCPKTSQRWSICTQGLMSESGWWLKQRAVAKVAKAAARR